ncbi:MAG: glycosyltransferase family 4 protein [Pseudomonadota bacterium]
MTADNTAPSATPYMDAVRARQPLAGRRVLILVENLAVPFDRRVWHECLTLKGAGAEVSVICPIGQGYDARYENINGVHIYRHTLPADGEGALGYLREYSVALWQEMRISLRIKRQHGFDTIQACNPPDLLFLVALPFKLFGRTRFVFDHHDVNPELYEAKFERRGFFHRLLLLFERLTFKTADVVMSTNESYAEIAGDRGKVDPRDNFIVRSGPNLARLKVVPPEPAWRNGRDHMIGYIGVMGDQEGLDLFLETARVMVYERGRNVQFVLMGDGPALEGLRALAAELGVADYITFTGWANDEIVFPVLSTADVCVGPDRVNAMNDKSTMNKVLEYMAFSRPIVQFNVTEGRRSAGDASLYAKVNDPVDFADRIIELLDDPDRRAEMGQLGHERIFGELSWDHQVDSLIAAYERVAQKRPR